MLLERAPEERLKMGCSMGARRGSWFARQYWRRTRMRRRPRCAGLCSCASTVTSSARSS